MQFRVGFRQVAVTASTRHYGVSASVTPHRTPIGVVTATSIALAVAVLGRGEFVDLNIRSIDPPVPDPLEFIGPTRVPASGLLLQAACLAWVRQCPDLKGWPPE